jgi:hypothetical protein
MQFVTLKLRNEPAHGCETTSGLAFGNNETGRVLCPKRHEQNPTWNPGVARSNVAPTTGIYLSPAVLELRWVF